LFDRVGQFVGNATTTADDMTLVVLRVAVPGELKNEEKPRRRIELPPI
jgi:hypothetical protein